MTATDVFPLPKNPRFEAYQDHKHEWRWRLRAANGLIVADSAEGYDKKGNAIRAATVVRGLIRRSGIPIPIVHWEPGMQDKGGRRPKNAAKARAAKGLGPRADALPQGEP